MRTIFLNVIIAVFLTTAHAQNLSIGLIGGASPTGDFQNQRTAPSQYFLGSIDYSTPTRYVVGATIEYRWARFSLEGNALYHPLAYTSAGVTSDGTLNSISHATVVTWEFPVLAKYRFSAGRIRPFIEAGPSFRTTGNLNSADPSHYGVTGGLGMETRLGNWNISPVVRYTRWAHPHYPQNVVPEVPDQVELLVGFNHVSETNWNPVGGRVSIGAVIGVNLTSDFRSQRDEFPIDGATVVMLAQPGPKSVQGGAMMELSVYGNLSLEVDGISQSLKGRSQTRIIGTPTEPTLLPVDFNYSVHQWKFPVLAKYRFDLGRLKPFAEVGPSFRVPPGGSHDSHFGVTAGLGVETHVRKLKIAPAVRYTRWGPNAFADFSLDRRDQAEFITGFFF